MHDSSSHMSSTVLVPKNRSCRFFVAVFYPGCSPADVCDAVHVQYNVRLLLIGLT